MKEYIEYRTNDVLFRGEGIITDKLEPSLFYKILHNITLKFLIKWEVVYKFKKNVLSLRDDGYDVSTKPFTIITGTDMFGFLWDFIENPTIKKDSYIYLKNDLFSPDKKGILVNCILKSNNIAFTCKNWPSMNYWKLRCDYEIAYNKKLNKKLEEKEAMQLGRDIVDVYKSIIKV